MMNSEPQFIQSGYIHNAGVSALVEESAAYCLRTGCAPVIVLSQAITCDPKSTLDNIALHLFNRDIEGYKPRIIHTLSQFNVFSGTDDKDSAGPIWRKLLPAPLSMRNLRLVD